MSASSGGPTTSRSYDSPELYRKDTLIRIKRLEAEISGLQKEINLRERALLYRNSRCQTSA